MGDAGAMGGSAADTMTLSGIQTSTGAKTFNDQKLVFRNPAGTFSGTQINPAVTANVNLEYEGPYSYIIYKAGSTIKRMDAITRAVVSSGTVADVQIQAAIDALGNDSGKAIFIKNSAGGNLFTYDNPQFYRYKRQLSDSRRT